MTDTTETERLHDQILSLQAELATVRDLLRTENQRANAAIDREETAEEAALEAHEEVRRLRAASAVVPAADRAAVLRDFVSELDERLLGCCEECNACAAIARDLAAELAVESAAVDRVAAETPQPETDAVLLALVRDFLDPDPCQFDHHGYCQAHAAGFGGEPMSCPHRRAREVLAEIDSGQPGPAVEAQPGNDTKTPVGYSGKGRLWCLTCRRPDGENLPVTIAVVRDGELCAGCGRDVVDVARATEQPKEA